MCVVSWGLLLCRTYDRAAIYLRGRKANLNFPLEDYLGPDELLLELIFLPKDDFIKTLRTMSQVQVQIMTNETLCFTINRFKAVQICASTAVTSCEQRELSNIARLPIMLHSDIRGADGCRQDSGRAGDVNEAGDIASRAIAQLQPPSPDPSSAAPSQLRFPSTKTRVTQDLSAPARSMAATPSAGNSSIPASIMTSTLQLPTGPQGATTAPESGARVDALASYHTAKRLATSSLHHLIPPGNCGDACQPFPPCFSLE